MRFAKMHGAGNDYVFIDLWTESVPADLPALARRLSDRHTGVGGDGMILIGPSAVANARMRIFNADGSEAEMCGNGLRCVARYLAERRNVGTDLIRVETGRGVLDARVLRDGAAVRAVRSSLGAPRLRADEIPTRLIPLRADAPLTDMPVQVAGIERRVTAVSMGNPHAALFVESLDDELVRTVGPALERHPAFPARTNVEFVRIVARDEIIVRVWERGAGETMACGTGAGAAVVAGALTGRTDRSVRCRMPGGALDVEWAESGEVFLTGPADWCFDGETPSDS